MAGLAGELDAVDHVGARGDGQGVAADDRRAAVGRPARSVGIPHKYAALALLCAAQFVDVLDVNATVVALPTIGRELGFTPATLQWVTTAYVLFFGGFLLLAGRLADLYGRRRMFVSGLSLFTAASLLCGLAWSPLALIVFRAAQGLGAALAAPAALAIIVTTFPEGRARNQAMGVWTAVAAGGGAAGLVLGGLLTDRLGWQWIFFINVPVGVLGVVLSFRLLEADHGARATRRLDLLGAVTITSALVLLVYGLTQATEVGFRTPRTLGTITLAAALLAAFPFIERRTPEPLVPLAIFRRRALSASALAAFVNTATTSSVGILAVLYLQEVLTLSPTMAGLLGLPLSLAVVLGSALGSRLTGTLGAPRTMALGLAGIAAGTLIALGIDAEGGLRYVVASATLSGLALGTSAVASTTFGTSAVGQDKRGLASGILNSAAQLGTALGLAVFVAVATTRTNAAIVEGMAHAEALVVGYRWAFAGAATLALLGALVTRSLLRADTARVSAPNPE
jgi:EmrB/QacA subfamily drug resistance transporter